MAQPAGAELRDRGKASWSLGKGYGGGERGREFPESRCATRAEPVPEGTASRAQPAARRVTLPRPPNAPLRPPQFWEQQAALSDGKRES